MEATKVEVVECYGCGDSPVDPESLRDYGYSLCKGCINNHDNKTGYCSMDCCLGGGCDGSC